MSRAGFGSSTPIRPAVSHDDSFEIPVPDDRTARPNDYPQVRMSATGPGGPNHASDYSHVSISMLLHHVGSQQQQRSNVNVQNLDDSVESHQMATDPILIIGRRRPERYAINPEQRVVLY